MDKDQWENFLAQSVLRIDGNNPQEWQKVLDDFETPSSEPHIEILLPGYQDLYTVPLNNKTKAFELMFLTAVGNQKFGILDEMVNNWPLGLESLTKLAIKINDEDLLRSVYTTASQGERPSLRKIIEKNKNVEAAYRVIQPSFSRKKGKLLFGSDLVGGRKEISERDIREKIVNPYHGSFDSHQMMTLRESSPDVYERVTTSLKKLPFVINSKKKQFVKIEVSDPGFLKFVKEKWGNDAQVVSRPYNYRNRDFVDQTDKFSMQYFNSPVKVLDKESEKVLVPESPTSPLSPTEINADKERLKLEKEANKQIKERLEEKYPILAELLPKVKRTGADLFIDEKFLFPSKYIQQSGLVYLPKFKLMWREELLSQEDFDAATAGDRNIETDFFTVILDLIDYVR